MGSMTTTTVDVTGGVDTHKDTHHAAILDQQGKLLATQGFPATAKGYQRLLAWMRSFGDLANIGVEGTGSYGVGLSTFLHSQGVSVVEVNRPNRRTRRMRGKSDPIDAEQAARAVLSREATAAPKDHTGIVESIRTLRVTRDGAVKARTAALNQLKDLVTTAPESLRAQFRGRSLTTTARACQRLRPNQDTLADPLHAVKAAMHSLACRIRDLSAEIAALTKQLATLVAQAAPRTTDLLGISTEHAGQLLVTAGNNPERMHSESAFTALCAACPIPASSGKTNRHRLNPGGDRAANSTLHMIAVVRMRWCPATRDYVKRRLTEGMAKRDIIRCLKRYIARQVFRTLRTDLKDLTNDT